MITLTRIILGPRLLISRVIATEVLDQYPDAIPAAIVAVVGPKGNPGPEGPEGPMGTMDVDAANDGLSIIGNQMRMDIESLPLAGTS